MFEISNSKSALYTTWSLALIISISSSLMGSSLVTFSVNTWSSLSFLRSLEFSDFVGVKKSALPVKGEQAPFSISVESYLSTGGGDST